jgi:hypothetical protein
MWYKAAAISFLTFVIVYVSIVHFLFHDDLTYAIKSGGVVGAFSALFGTFWIYRLRRRKEKQQIKG